MTNPDGSWEYTQYTPAGAKWRVFSSYGNQLPTTAPGLCRMSEYAYQPLAPQDDGTVRPRWPRCVVDYLKGREIGRTYYVISLGEERKIQFAEFERLVPPSRTLRPWREALWFGIREIRVIRGLSGGAEALLPNTGLTADGAVSLATTDCLTQSPRSPPRRHILRPFLNRSTIRAAA